MERGSFWRGVIYVCKRFAEWCKKCCDGIFGINNSVVGDTADSLSNKPMIYAVGLAFGFRCCGWRLRQ